MTDSRKRSAASGPDSEPADDERATSGSKAPRRCRLIIVLGSGSPPADDFAAECVQKFRTAHADGLEYGPAEQVVGSVAAWPAGDTSAMKSAVRDFAAGRCFERDVPYDERRLLIRDYHSDDGLNCAVAAFFPVQTYWSKHPEAASSPPRFARLIEQAKALPAAAKKKLAVGAAATLAVLIGAMLLLPGGDPVEEVLDDEAGETDTDGSVEVADRKSAPALPPVRFATGLLRIYTPEPGFHVAVNGQPVRDAEGEFVTTPCAVTALAGAAPVTLFREGWIDVSRIAEFSQDGEITLEPSADTINAGSDFLAAPHREATTGTPIALSKVNSSAPELSPYVTPDGLSIWFAADRTEGRGIYVATRASTFHNFDEPRLVSRSSDMPATPSVTDDGLYVAYAVPEKARLIALSRPNPLSEFGEREFLPYSQSLAPTWASSQILGDGTRIYWTEFTDEGVRTLGASRSDITDPFGKWFKLTLPGTHPCMSQDGLRHYTFIDGELTRYRRTSATERFIKEAVIATLELNNYSPARMHRQFCVSSDEQWMFYSDDPINGGDLYMVRLSDAPQWGIAPRGKSIPEKAVIAANEPMPEEEMEFIPEKAPPKPVDPRSLPLPYTAHTDVFRTLMAAHKYDEVDSLLQTAESNDQLAANREQLAWDKDDASAIRSFWDALDSGLTKLNSGDQVRIGTLRFEFVSYENGVISGKRGDSDITRNTRELGLSELSSLFDQFTEKDDAQSQYQFGVFISYEADLVERARDQRFERAGQLADQFRERQARRHLVQAVAELKRSNFGRGVEFLKRTQSLAGGTPVATEADSLEAQLYDYIKWNKRGPRVWQNADHIWTASLDRSDDSLLVSELQYENFELSLDWKTENAATAQGGVYFRYTGSGLLIDNAFKIHLANDYGVAADMYCTGSLFGSEDPKENAVKAAGEWNSLNIKVLGEAVTVTINGRKVLETSARSSTIPLKGYICLDGVTGGIAYRKILISELPAP